METDITKPVGKLAEYQIKWETIGWQEVNETERKFCAWFKAALLRESEWDMYGKVACSSEFPFMFMQPDAHAFKLHMFNDIEDIKICYENRCFHEPRLKIKGETFRNPKEICGNDLISRICDNYAYPLHRKLAAMHSERVKKARMESVLTKSKTLLQKIFS